MNLLKNFFLLFLLVLTNVCSAQLIKNIAFVFDKGGLRKMRGTAPDAFEKERIYFLSGEIKKQYENKYDAVNNVYSMKNFRATREINYLFRTDKPDPVFIADSLNRSWEVTFKREKSSDPYSGLGVETWSSDKNEPHRLMRYVFGIQENKFIVSAVFPNGNNDTTGVRVIVPPTNCAKINVNEYNTLMASRINNEWTFLINGDTVFKYRDARNDNFNDFPIMFYTEGKSNNLISRIKVCGYSSSPYQSSFKYNGANSFNQTALVSKANDKYLFSMLSFYDGLMTVRGKNGKYGAIDSNGVEVLPCVYDELSTFTYGLSPAKTGGQVGYIDQKGTFVISLPGYVYTQTFQEGYAVVQKEAGGPYAFIDETGDLVTDFVYEKAREFENGRAEVTKGGKKMYLNRQLQEVY